MDNIFDQFFKIFGTQTTTNFQLIQWAKWLNIKPFHYAMTDEIKNLPKSQGFAAIINYQNSNQPGSHHVALWHSKEDSVYNFYFDSFGFEPQKEIIKYYKPIRTSNYEIQKFNTELCGQLSLLVIYLLNNNFKYEDIILDLLNYFKNE